MKQLSRREFLRGSILAAAATALAACTTNAATTVAPTAIPATDTVAPVVPTATTAAATAAATTAATAAATTAPTSAAPTLDRKKTMYFNGQQWNAVTGWNPYSSNMNNALAIAQQDSARVLMFETPYLYDMLDAKQYPLLADGAWAWDTNMTQITFKLKKAALWSDGTAVTADDVAYTWASNVKYKTSTGTNYSSYIDSVTATDAQTVVIKAKLDTNGKTINPLQLISFVSGVYVIQKKWTQTLEARVSNDATKFMADTASDVVYSGPYGYYFADDTQVILVRNDKYWGQDASMFGKLPVPQYLGHAIFKDNASGTAAFQAGQVDVSQEFISNVQDLWKKSNLPISTYLPDAPYDIGATLPTMFFNSASYGLDQLPVRKAIAIAVDYDTIIANAMTNQSATFTQVPRSLMNPTDAEQALFDKTAVKDLQWAGKDIDGAKKLLDAAGIKDTNNDGFREYNGKTLHYTASCPNGWSDWQAAVEVVAAAGKAIGIDIVTNYPDPDPFEKAVTNWPLPTTGYDMFVMWTDGAGPTQPWSRIRKLMSSEFYQTANNWNGNWGAYKNADADKLIQSIPAMTDTAKIKDAYTQLVKMYLTDIPSFTLMYRPQSFHTVNETVWTNFPHQNDGTTPAVPPLDLMDGWSVAGLYNVKLVS